MPRRVDRLRLGPAVTGLALAAASAASATPPPIMRARMSPPAPTAVTVRGLGGQVASFTAADLGRMPQERLTLTHMGRTSQYAGPELASLLRQVDAPLGARMHGAAVAVVVLATASDGYRVALSLGEVDPELHGGAKVILADEEDGRPLPPDEAPARLVIEGDVRPARDVHSIATLELRQLP